MTTGERNRLKEGLTPVTPQEGFWANVGPEELARQQGIKPLASLEQLRIPSLADEDADDLIRELRQLRAAARGDAPALPRRT